MKKYELDLLRAIDFAASNVVHDDTPKVALAYSKVHELATVYVPTVSELSSLLLKVGVDSDYVTETVMHESEHADAAIKLGATSVRYGVYVQNHDTEPNLGDLTLTPFCDATVKTPPLGAAAITAYPTVVSEGDISTLNLNGYDVDKVGFDTTYLNNLYGHDWPVPLSYNPPATVVDLKSRSNGL